MQIARCPCASAAMLPLQKSAEGEEMNAAAAVAVAVASVPSADASTVIKPICRLVPSAHERDSDVVALTVPTRPGSAGG